MASITKIRIKLLRLPRWAKKSLVIILDTFLSALCVWIIFGIQINQWEILNKNQLIATAISIAFAIPIFIYFGLYRAIFRYLGSNAFIAIAKAFLIYTFLYFCLFSLIGVDGVPRSIGVFQPAIFFIIIGLVRYLIRVYLNDGQPNSRSVSRVTSRVLIYGAGAAGRQLAETLRHANNTIIKGFIDDNPKLQASTINEIPIFFSSNIKEEIKRLGVNEVLLAIPSASQSRRSEIISSLKLCDVRVKTIPSFSDLTSWQYTVGHEYDLYINDLLERSVVEPNDDLLEKNIKDNFVLITGAGGSIGGELCRQILKLSPKSLILVENNEHALYLIYEELKTFLVNNDINNSNSTQELNNVSSEGYLKESSIKLVPCLASVCDKGRLDSVFRKNQPKVVFHAAAYKHVPLVELNPEEGINNNVFGTLNCVEVSLEHDVQQFILVSTDKAVRPTNVMGASKRVAELVLQAMADEVYKGSKNTRFSMVRFGNVLGSSGSVIPLFKAQINKGGPITLTHKDITRYFMTIPEAAQLVIQASAMSTGGDVFVLDMGDPVRIYDLAVNMIYLSGLMVKDENNPDGDIEIIITGLRPGEKLYEELLIGNNPLPTSHPKIMMTHEEFLPWSKLEKELQDLKCHINEHDYPSIFKLIQRLVPEFRHDSGRVIN